MVELLVLRLVPATARVPQSVSLYCEQILTEMAHSSRVNDIVSGAAANGQGVGISPKVIALLLPYISAHSGSVNVQLFVLHVATGVVKHISTNQLINFSSFGTITIQQQQPSSLVQVMISKTVSLLSSSVIDLRQSVIFLYVALHDCLGDVLWKYLDALTQTQRALLGIYIERQQKLKGMQSFS